MKLFDFKFLILLGLTLVVYFMYKEIDIQRERIQRLEELYKKLVDKDDHVCDLENEDDVLSLPPPPPQKNVEIKSTQDNNNLKLDLPRKMLEVVNKPSSNVKVISESTEEESDSTTTSTTSSMKSNTDKKSEVLVENKHLEIYSNDNENLEETSISDSLINKDNLNKSVKSESVEEDIKKLSVKSESVEDDAKKSSVKSESLEDVLNNLELNTLDLEINTKKSPKTDTVTLSKLKLGELQDLAKKENINLDKKVNGVNKKKTKQELIDEIIEIKKKISN
jgi:hypothetical protein